MRFPFHRYSGLIDRGRWSARFGVFSPFVSLLFLTWFLTGFFSDFGEVLEPQIGPQTCFWDVFGDAFFGGHLGMYFY